MGRHKKAMGIAPAFLGRLGIETLHSTLPFGVEFRHLPQLRCGTEPASLDIPHIRHVVRRANVAGCSPRPQALDEIGHARADEMVLQPPSFKPEAGGREV